MASKEDLKGMDSKEDLKGMDSKEDIKGMARKEDLQELKEFMKDIKIVLLLMYLLKNGIGRKIGTYSN